MAPDGEPVEETSPVSKDDVADDDKRTSNNSTEDEASRDAPEISLGCGILGRYPIISLLCFVVAGAALGVGLSYWRPEDAQGINNKAVALQWINLVGDLFLRMLKCIVLPIVFVNVIIAVVDMMAAGKAGGVGGYTVLLYLCTTIIAGILACIYSLIYSRWYLMGDAPATTPAFVTLGCSQDGYLMEVGNGTVACSSEYSSTNDILWILGDVNETFVRANTGGVVDDNMSLSDTIYQGVFLTLIPENIFQEFYNANYAAVIVFAIAVGVAISKMITAQNIRSTDITLMSILVDLDRILTIMICWVIMLTPFAVFSLVAAAIGNEDDLGSLFKNMGLLIACILTAYVTHFLCTYCGGYWVLTKRQNPFSYVSHMQPAQLMAFASSSSAATIPLSTESVLSTHLVPESIVRFVIPLGATVNMDGACIQIVASCIWLAYFNGIEVNAANYVLLVIISTFGSMGTAPVPNATLALIITSYNTVFNTTGTPDGFSYLFAIDWFMDRCSTVLNVTGDMTVCGIIGSFVDIDPRNSVRSKVYAHHEMRHELYEHFQESAMFSTRTNQSSTNARAFNETTADA